MSNSALEAELAFQIRAYKLPVPHREFHFAAMHVGTGRGIRNRLRAAGLKDWRFDFAWPDLMLAVEVEGVTPEGGGHQKIAGFLGDIEKYHHAQRLGWTIYRTSGPLIKSGDAVRLIADLIAGE